MEALSVFAIAFVLILYVALCLGSLVYYVLSALSLMQLADCLGVKNAWLSWLPIGNTYVLGATADKLEERRGISHKWGRLLLILNLVIGAVLGLVFVALLAFIAYIGIAEASGAFYNEEMLIAPFVGIYLIYFVVIFVAMAVSYLTVICAYKIFEEIAPKKSIKYLLICLLVPFGNVFCFFRCKKLLEAQLRAQQAAQAQAAAEQAAPIAESAQEPEKAGDAALAFGYDATPSAQEEKKDEEKTDENDQQ